MGKKVLWYALSVAVAAGLGWWYWSSRDSMPISPGIQIELIEPVAGSIITQAPLMVRGKAPGSWFFEASFPAILVASDGTELGIGIMQAQSDWMTDQSVAFEGEVYFDMPATQDLALVLKKDNPSGLPELDASVGIPLKNGISARTVQVFFANDRLDPEVSCTKVFPVERQIPHTQQIARYALMELLRGPSGDDAREGYATALAPETELVDISITNNIARAVFDESLDQGIGGSCRVSVIRKQIEATLKQFPTVSGVEICRGSECNQELILQP